MVNNNLAIADELEDVAMQLAGYGLLEDDTSLATCQASATDVVNEFQRLQLASDMLEYDALNPIMAWLIKNAEQAANMPCTFVLLQNDGHFFQWAELLAATLRQQDKLFLPDLTSSLTHPAWPTALPKNTLETFLLSLTEPEGAVEAVASMTATPQSTYTIDWDDDIHPEVLEAFLSDTPDQITESAALIHKISSGNASAEEHQLAARLTHTIKGASGVVGVTSLIAFTHQLEEILEYSVEHSLDSKAQELLSASADCLAGMGEAMLNQRALPNEFEPLLAQLESTAKQLQHTERLDSDDIDLDRSIPSDAHESDIINFSAPPPKIIVSTAIDKPAMKIEQLTPQLLADTPTEPQSRSRIFRANEATMRVPISLIDDLLNLAEELVTSTSQVSDKVKLVLQQSQQLRLQDDQLSGNMDELEQSIDRQFQQLGPQSKQPAEFDPLELEVYNELHSVHGLLSETIADNRQVERSIQENLRQLSNQLHSQQRINRELNATILDTRMESLDTLTSRLERIVRETCRSTGKQATFTITGNNLAVDTDILKGLTDPLLHLLRNAIDHGIEELAQRQAKGKSDKGLIELSFKQDGRYVLMSLKDDGAGIDAEAVYQRAVAQGIVEPNQPLSDADKLQLILLPGFTTRDVVSNISGRGVGMDVVNDAVSNLRGALDLKSTPDRGTEVIIRLPFTLVAANTLLVEVSGRTVAIPIDSIDKLHTLAANTVTMKEAHLTTDISGKSYQVLRLSQLLNWGNPHIDPAETHDVILIAHKQRLYALIIDTVLQPKDVVVKSLAPWLSNIPGINGACLLGDGAVAAVLDLPRLLQLDILEHTSQTMMPVTNTEKTVPLIMVVDDSLSNRKSLSIIAEQLGYKTMTASDGEEAFTLITEQLPDVILSDLEMPRMNGLELTQAVRSSPNTQHIPIVMITSRATTKHRKQAQLAGVNSYIVKPVDRDTLQNQFKKWLN